MTGESTSIERVGGLGAILAGVFVLLYSIAFVIISRSDAQLGALLSALFLMLGGLVTMPVLAAVYGRLRETDSGMALWALLLGVAGAFGATVHGGYDLANAINPPGPIPTGVQDLPNQLDPRALLTFGAAGLGQLIVAWLIVRGGQFPKGIGYLGFAFAVLLIILYLGRLIILNPANPAIVAPAILTGFLVSPIWNIWMGIALWRGR